MIKRSHFFPHLQRNPLGTEVLIDTGNGVLQLRDTKEGKAWIVSVTERIKRGEEREGIHLGLGPVNRGDNRNNIRHKHRAVRASKVCASQGCPVLRCAIFFGGRTHRISDRSFIWRGAHINTGNHHHERCNYLPPQMRVR